MSIDHYKKNSPGAFVRWYHPEMAQEATFGAGRKKKILDLFGVWRLAEDMAISEPGLHSLRGVLMVCLHILSRLTS